MERHIAKVTAFSAGVSLIAGTFAFAAVGGLSMLGLGSVKTVHESLAGPALPQDTTAATELVGATAALTNGPIVVPVGQPSTSSASRAGSAAIILVQPQPGPGAVVDTPTSPAAPTSPSPIVPAPTAAPTSAPSSVAPPTTPKTVPPTVATVPATTAPATTAPRAPTTTLPPGVPTDWPAGKPIPPMPPHCVQPQLELTGVWNCQD